jgi:hypothetical protein
MGDQTASPHLWVVLDSLELRTLVPTIATRTGVYLFMRDDSAQIARSRFALKQEPVYTLT